jgi:hypothetical protein
MFLENILSRDVFDDSSDFEDSKYVEHARGAFYQK